MSPRRAVPPSAAALGSAAQVRREALRRDALRTGRSRLLIAGAVFAAAFTVVAGRATQLALAETGQHAPTAQSDAAAVEAPVSRAEIVDRNGVVLATSLPTASLYADTRQVPDPRESARRLATALPDADPALLAEKLASGRSFVWLHRNLTPHQQYEINRLGIPGLSFRRAERRVYPQGPLAAHVLGMTDIDGHGIAGVEGFFDDRLRTTHAPLALSIDIRVQSMLRDGLARAMAEFGGIGAAGLVLDARDGELLALVSLPDFDPNAPSDSPVDSLFNRVTKGVYEMGSTFKLFTAAMALDSGTVNMASGYDASEPIRVARFTIRDFHGENRWLSVPEIIVHSSNIGAAKMALDVGTRTQREYLGRLGLLAKASLELPEIGSPLVPDRWRDINTMTISFGHGIAVTPLQVAVGVAALVNDGATRPATLLRTDRAPDAGRRVVSERTSRQIRDLMRLVVEHGTGRNAAVPGYLVGGKTGTAEKQDGRRYRRDARLASFVGAFPLDDPRFVVLAMIDEPKGRKHTLGFATGGWVAAPVVGEVIRQLATLYGIAPDPALLDRDAVGGGTRLASY